MAGKLTARGVSALKEPGRHSDGDGLYVQISKAGARSWLFLFKRDGKQREMGLGSLKNVGLAEAREKAAEARKVLARGEDPIDARRAAEAASASLKALPTFGSFADDFVKGIAPGFRNEKHVAQWRSTLSDAYVKTLRPIRIDEVATDDVLAVLSPIWLAKNETASRLRGRIERVLDAARARGLRSGENPARWKGHLDALLPKASGTERGHHAAMPYADVPAFVERLRRVSGISARALEFTILTAARSGETRGATWSEFDLDGKLWTVPATRMKAGREHRVPLSERAIAILREVMPLRRSDDPAILVFPGAKLGKPLSVMSFDMTLRRLGADCTTHGFRSAFRDWVGEETVFPREVAESALAHVVGDAVERAYRRGDALEKRRALMAAWSQFVEPGVEPAKVVPLRRGRRSA